LLDPFKYALSLALKNIFFKVIPKIKNDNLFWVLFGVFYVYYEITSFSLNQFLEIITKKRLKVSLLDRNRLSSVLIYIHQYRDEKDTEKIETFKDFKKYLDEKAFTLLKKTEEPNSLKPNIFQSIETFYASILKTKKIQNEIVVFRGMTGFIATFCASKFKS
jgi:hypothetical protein